jgi:formate dehydrogenase beta subunit
MTPKTGQLQILPALRQIQETYGYLKRDALIRLGKDSGIHLHRIQEVASFFPHFRLTPAPAVTVRVCRDMACHLAGSAFALDQLRPMAGERVCVEGVSCLSRCDRPPAVRLEIRQAPDPGNRPGQRQQHEFYCLGRDLADLTRIVTACLEGKSVSAEADSDAGLAHASADWMIDPYKGRSRDYDAIKKVISARDEEWRSVTGALKGKGRSRPWTKPADFFWEDVDDESVKAPPRGWIDAVLTQFDDAHANLRGLGGAGVPATRKWTDVRDEVAKAQRRGTDSRAFVVVNGDESEPATFKDRELLLHFPHLIVEGLILAGLVTGATEGFIYIRHEYPEQIAACNAEIRRAESLGICGIVAPLLGRQFPVSVFVSPGGYICGEQSALLEAMSDRRGEPRNLPPPLETNGLHDRPTLVSNVETFAWVPYILINGGTTYGSLGVNGRKGRRFFSVCGDVTRPGVYEVPMGLTLRKLICGDEYCRGLAGGKQLKAIAPSGPSGGFLPARIKTPCALPPDKRAMAVWRELADRRGFDPLAQELDILDMELELDLFRALSPTHALGAGIVVYAEGRDMVEQAVNAMEFFRNESCGKCVPCRIGSQKLANLGANLLAGRIDAASWRNKLLPLMVELIGVIGATSICGLGRSVPQPLVTLVNHFGQDLDRYLRNPDAAL